MTWYRKRPIAFQILLLLILCLIPINILFFISAGISLQTYQEEVVQANENVLDVYAARLQALVDRADSFIATQIISGEDLLSGKTSTEKEVTLMNIFYQMQEETSDYEFDTGMFAFEEGETRIYMACENVISAAEYADLKKSLLAHYQSDDIFGWQMVDWNDHTYLIRCYRTAGLCYGVFVPLESIADTIEAEFSYTQVSVTFAESSRKTSLTGETLVMESDTLSIGFLLAMEVPADEISRAVPQMQQALLLIAILTFAIVPLLYLAIRKIVLSPLKELNQALHTVEGGDVNYRIPQHEDAQEFMHIDQSFNGMLDEILKLRNEKYEYELDRQKHEMISLQMQIKPHFLYNSFNDISNMALVGDYGGIRELMGYLAEYFRYTIRTGYELVPLQRELDFLKVYYAIMEMRHPGCFEYEITVDPRVREIEILPLVIHTFVENTMTHTVKEGDYITSRILIRPEGERLRIYISDDGEGIEQEALQQIEQKKKMEDAFGKEHIGIWNCYKRLQIFYHGDADIIVRSAYMEGTTVTIDMPLENASPQANAVKEEVNEEEGKS